MDAPLTGRAPHPRRHLSFPKMAPTWPRRGADVARGNSGRGGARSMRTGRHTWI